MGIARYVFIFAVWGFVIAGAYWAGYSVGSRDVKIEYVVKEKELIIVRLQIKMLLKK